MAYNKKLLFECRVLKQVLYKVKNQLGRSVQYRRMKHVYKALLKFIAGEFVVDFGEILVKAGLSVLDPLKKNILVPVYSVLIGIYARIYSALQTPEEEPKTKILSRKLKRIIMLQKNFKSPPLLPKPSFKEIEILLESIRSKL